MRILLIIFAFFSIAFGYRVYGIFDNHPFWVDEFSSANQARLILENGLAVFSRSDIWFERHNTVTYFIVAGFFKLFGQSESVARLPFVIIGSFVPIMVFLLARKLYNVSTAICATLLTIFSYFEITWSRQARSYVLLQLIILIVVFMYVTNLKRKHASKLTVLHNFSIFYIAIILGILTHALFLIFFAALILDFFIFHRTIFKKILKKPFIYILFIIIIGISYKTGLLYEIFREIISNPIKTNNLKYYHSFLWREYGLLSFLALVGFLISFFTKRKNLNLIIIYILFHLLFISFSFTAYVSRYLSPLFPFIFIQTSFAITHLTQLVLMEYKAHQSKLLYFIPFSIIIFIIINSNKFVIKPHRFYSVNHDFREIALLDYNKIYKIIKTRGELHLKKTAIVDTWQDRLFWYLGRDFKQAYLFRWIDEPELINGLRKKTYYTFNNNGEKIIPQHKNLRFIGELSDLKKAMSQYPKGFIFIDDTSLPKDVIDYAEKNFKKELYLDHYPLDDNPYSIWPATLYSWGIP